MRHIDRLSGGAGCLAKCGDLLRADSQELSEKKWLLAVLSSAQVFLADQGQCPDVFPRADVLGVNLPVQAAIKFTVALGVGQNAAKMGDLDLLQLLSRKGFDKRVPIGLLG
jgi:hypothetical protein